MGKNADTRALPQGPRWPATIQLYQWSMRPFDMLDNAHRRFGERFTIRLAGYGTLVILASPTAVRDVFRGDPRVLHSGEANRFLGQVVGKSSVLVLDDQPHTRQRHVLVPAFKGERMRRFFDTLYELTIRSVDAWPVNASFGVAETMRDITLRLILEATLGQGSDESGDLVARVKRLLNFGATRWSLFLTKMAESLRLERAKFIPFFQQVGQLDARIFELIRRRRAHGLGDPSHAPDILDDLLTEQHRDGGQMGDDEVRDAVVTSLFAGHETTATALAWAFEQILAHPQVMARISGELEDVARGGALEPEHLPQLEYLDAVIRESLRVRTIIPFVTRLLKEPFSAGGDPYPAGIQLAPCAHLIHQREELYPEPNLFIPDRFLRHRFGPHEWFPFGGGNRMCLGMPFALFEMKVVLATIFSRVRLERPLGAVSRVARRGIVLAPSDGVVVRVVDRLVHESGNGVPGSRAHQPSRS